MFIFLFMTDLFITNTKDHPCISPPLYKPPLYKPPLYKPPLYKPPLYKPPLYKPPLYKPPLYKPPLYKPPLYKPPLYKPIKNRLRKYISPGLIVGGLRYLTLPTTHTCFIAVNFSIHTGGGSETFLLL